MRPFLNAELCRGVIYTAKAITVGEANCGLTSHAIAWSLMHIVTEDTQTEACQHIVIDGFWVRRIHIILMHFIIFLIKYTII